METMAQKVTRRAVAAAWRKFDRRYVELESVRDDPVFRKLEWKAQQQFESEMARVDVEGKIREHGIRLVYRASVGRAYLRLLEWTGSYLAGFSH